MKYFVAVFLMLISITAYAESRLSNDYDAVQRTKVAEGDVSLNAPEANPWYIVRDTQPEHDADTIHLEMGIQLERALDVAYDELRKVDQSVQDAPRPFIEILIYRHDGHTVLIEGDRYKIRKQLVEPSFRCNDPVWPNDPNDCD